MGAILSGSVWCARMASVCLSVLNLASSLVMGLVFLDSQLARSLPKRRFSWIPATSPPAAQLILPWHGCLRGSRDLTDFGKGAASTGYDATPVVLVPMGMILICGPSLTRLQSDKGKSSMPFSRCTKVTQEDPAPALESLFPSSRNEQREQVSHIKLSHKMVLTGSRKMIGDIQTKHLCWQEPG